MYIVHCTMYMYSHFVNVPNIYHVAINIQSIEHTHYIYNDTKNDKEKIFIDSAIM